MSLKITEITVLDSMVAYIAYAAFCFLFVGLLIVFTVSKIVGSQYFDIKGAEVSKFLVLGTLLLFIFLLANIGKFMVQNSVSTIWCCNGLFVLSFWQLLFQISATFFIIAMYCALEKHSKIIGSFNVESEFDFLTGMMLLAGLLVITANDLLVAYFCIELQTIPMFAILAIHGFSLKAVDASLKYFILSIVSSSILLFGIALVYNTFGTTRFAFLKLLEFYSVSFLTFAKVKYPIFILLARLGVILIIIALLFKLTAAPFNFWIVDIYNSVSYRAIVIFAILPKFSITALTLSIMTQALHSHIFIADWQFFLLVSAFLSIIIGTIGAFYHTRITAILAFGSISHIGFVVFSIIPFNFNEFFMTGTTIDMKLCSVFYLFAYSVAFLLIFVILFNLKIDGKPVFFLKQLSGIIATNKLVAVVLTTAMLSLAGLPPFIGFIAKFIILVEWVRQGWVITALTFFLLSLVSSAYYLRFIKVMWFDGTIANRSNFVITFKLSFAAKIILAALLLLVSVGGLYILFLHKYIV